MADKKKILAVDDEKDIRDTIKTILESKGYEVVTAKDGDDGLKKYKKEKPDLILLDIMMPGTPVKKIVKKIKKSKIIYVSVVQTSQDEKGDIMDQDNVVGYIQKPFDTNDLLKEVKKALKE